MAEYKFDTLASEEVVWQAGTGQTIIIRIAIVEQLWRLDEISDYSRKSLDIKWTGAVDGVKQNAYHIEPVKDHPAITHHFGNIGITAENYERLQDAYARIAAHPEWTKHQAAVEEGWRAMEWYIRESEDFEALMEQEG